MLAEEQRNSLIFSNEDLLKQYLLLNKLSPSDINDLRKTTNELFNPADSLEASQQDVPVNRLTMTAERRAIDTMGKNLLRLS